MRLFLALLLTVAAEAAPGLRLEGGPFLPYRINHGVVLAEGGLVGPLEVRGLRWDGVRTPLFRTSLAVRSRSVELAFYLDEDIRGLELEVGSGAPIAIPLEVAGPVDENETALKSRMRSLNPPVHLSPAGQAPQRLTLVGSDLSSAGFQAASALFGLPVSREPLAPLGAFAVLALLATLAATPRRRFAARVILAGASLGATVLVVHLGVPRSRLIRVVFPDATGGAQVARRAEALPDYTRVTYEGPEAGAVAMVGIWAPAGAGIPLADVVPPDALVRFSSPPLLTGEETILAREFVTGWVVHAEP